jgi:hypothetical protein
MGTPMKLLLSHETRLKKATAFKALTAEKTSKTINVNGNSVNGITINGNKC